LHVVELKGEINDKQMDNLLDDLVALGGFTEATVRPSVKKDSFLIKLTKGSFIDLYTFIEAAAKYGMKVNRVSQ